MSISLERCSYYVLVFTEEKMVQSPEFYQGPYFKQLQQNTKNITTTEEKIPIPRLEQKRTGSKLIFTSEQGLKDSNCTPKEKIRLTMDTFLKEGK